MATPPRQAHSPHQHSPSAVAALASEPASSGTRLSSGPQSSGTNTPLVPPAPDVPSPGPNLAASPSAPALPAPDGVARAEPVNPFDEPPAYTPPPRLTVEQASVLQANLRQLLANPTGENGDILLARGPMDHDEEDAEEEDTTRSPIEIRVNAGVRAAGDDNFIGLLGTPAQYASEIANAVLAAVRQASSAHVGIPMIDEDGRPRPLRIEVDASLDINGSRNVLGPEVMVREVNHRRAQKRERPVGAGGGEAGRDSAAGTSIKRVRGS